MPRLRNTGRRGIWKPTEKQRKRLIERNKEKRNKRRELGLNVRMRRI